MTFKLAVELIGRYIFKWTLFEILRSGVEAYISNVVMSVHNLLGTYRRLYLTHLGRQIIRIKIQILTIFCLSVKDLDGKTGEVNAGTLVRVSLPLLRPVS